MLDENGNVIEEGNGGQEGEQKQDVEYRKAKAEKYKGMFKAEKAKGGKETVNTDEILSKVNSEVDERFKAVEFYSKNNNAFEMKEDIEALVAKGIERERAYRFVISEKNPELLLDDQKKAQLNGNTDLNGVPAMINGKKNPQLMSEEEISKLSDKEFEELFPSPSAPKKFYGEA